MKKNNKKALVVGLDGVPFTLLEDFMGDGRLANFSRITGGGHRLHQMDASVPDVSSTSWTSFMTGVNPGEHGIFGFMDLEPGAYRMVFPKSTDIKSPTIWEIIAGQADKGSTLSERFSPRVPSPMRTIALNIPQTYPARPLNGILTAGFVCPDFKSGTYPESAYEYLSSMGYIPDVDAVKAMEDPSAFFNDVFLALEKRAEAYEHLMRDGGGEDWDLFIGVITETDRVHHFFFDSLVDPAGEHHPTLMTFYQRCDEIVGRLHDVFMELTGGEGLFMTMSDHGFTVAEREVYLNVWLAEKGYLKLGTAGEYYERIEPGTAAFNMDPARIYINLEGKYPRGSVAPSDRERVAREIASGLKELADPDGRPVIREVHLGSGIYTGASSELGPDIVCLAHDGFDLKGAIERDGVFGQGPFKGMHTSYDAHAMLPSDAAVDGRLHIEDIAGIILEHLTGAEE